MFSNVALDVVIGLIFIYLLYSLFATVLGEIIATMIGLRAYNLREAVNRMLTDERRKNGVKRFLDSLNIVKSPKNAIILKFYNNPEIKYLESTGLFRKPSAFKAETFSKTLLYELNGSGKLDKEAIEKELENLTKGNYEGRELNESEEKLNAAIAWKKTFYNYTFSVEKNPNPANAGVTGNKFRTLDEQSAQFVLSLFNYSNGDLVKFKIHLEAWFDRTMEQALEWYKRKIQVILLVLGFLMAWFFNADSFTIIRKLSTDDKAREQIVSMANAYVESNNSKLSQADVNPTVDSSRLNNYNKKLDSLLEVKKKLEEDINKANSILGLGGWLPDSVKVIYDPVKQKTVYIPEIEVAYIKPEIPDEKGYYRFSPVEKWYYLRRLFLPHFFGFLITAIAISLGAPFWFDLLNKIMRLRTSVKQPLDTTKGDDRIVSPINRIG